MNRRKALQQIGIFALSAKYFASCDFSKSTDAILDEKQTKFLTALSNLILPVDDLEIETPDTVTDFILTIITECKSEDEIKDFQKGMTEIQKNAQVNISELSKSTQTDIDNWFAKMMKMDETSIPKTLETIKALSIKHFTTSEYYLKNYTDYEFIPSRFNGCVEI